MKTLTPGFSLTVPKQPRPRTPEAWHLQSSQQSQRTQVIEVVIPSPSNILDSWHGLPPKSSVNSKLGRKELWHQLKESTKVAYEDPALVEHYFGQTGFSAAFSVKKEEDVLFMRKAASKKAKKTDRASIELDIEPLASTLSQLNLSKTKLVHPSRTARDILTSRFDEPIKPPLTFSNEVNSKRLHGKFQFIDRYILGDKVRPAPRSTNKGCRCSDCGLSSCLCFTKKVDDEVGKGKHDAQIRTYVRRPDGKVVLSDDFLIRELEPVGPHYEITECNEFCHCGPNCLNRVVGKGRTVALEIFQSQKCGFGVHSPEDIVKGQFIERYLGEVVTEAELLRREEAENDDDSSYIYSLDWFSKGTAQNNWIYHVDGKYFGSAMRFVNHSCDPNARCFTVQIHKEDRKVYFLAFFALKDIKAGVEIRIDYQGEGALDGSLQEEAGHPEFREGGQLSDDLVRCQCGEKNCRGILWTPGVKDRRRRRHKE